MQIGDTTVYTDANGHRSVIIITAVNLDGTLDFAQLRTTHENVTRSSRENRPGTVYDPLLAEAITPVTDVTDPPSP